MESISIREAADRLGVSHKVIRRLISQGTLEAHKHPGPHGAEWRVQTESLSAYQTGQSTGRHSAVSRVRLPASATAHSEECISREPLSSEKAFLQNQIIKLTDLLSQSIALREIPGKAPEAPPAVSECSRDITASLRSSLQSLLPEGIATIELCSVKVLWGRPVLWRVAATAKEDVQALLDAILAEEAVWSPPGEEVVFLWALGQDRNVIWGTACGPGWFGPGFEKALRGCRVERL